jgi:hypothetical protein
MACFLKLRVRLQCQTREVRRPLYRNLEVSMYRSVSHRSPSASHRPCIPSPEKQYYLVGPFLNFIEGKQDIYGCTSQEREKHEKRKKEKETCPFNVVLTGKSAFGSKAFPSGQVCIKKSGSFT